MNLRFFFNKIGHKRISIGNNQTRKELVSKLQDYSFSKAIHPHAIVDNSVFIGKGSVIMAGAVININAQIGNAASPRRRRRDAAHRTARGPSSGIDLMKRFRPSITSGKPQ